jgi:hypothetical protein
MSAQEVQTFNVGTLDLGGLTEDDLISQTKTTPSKQFAGYITKEGTYNFSVESYKLVTNPKLKDGAISVPLESLLYTSKSGSTTDVKTKIFCNFIQSITGNQVRPEEISGIVQGLPSLLTGGQFRAKVGARGDRVTYAGEVNDAPTYNITMQDGNVMVGSDGQALTFSDRDSAIAHYKAIKGFAPVKGLEFTSFYGRG